MKGVAQLVFELRWSSGLASSSLALPWEEEEMERRAVVCLKAWVWGALYRASEGDGGVGADEDGACGRTSWSESGASGC